MELGLITIFTAGLLTFLSPCILPVLPVYISMFVGAGVDEVAADPKKKFALFFNSLFFILGFIVVFVLMGMSATAIGSTLVKHKTLMQQLGGLLIFTFGLKFMGYLNIEFLNVEKRFQGGGGKFNLRFLNSFLAGFFFAFGWTPCVGPILGSILTFTAVSTTNIFKGGFYLFVYSIGFAIPLLLLPLFFEPVMAVLKKAKAWIPRIEKITGIILVVMGILMITDQMDIFEISVKPSQTQQIVQKSSSDQNGNSNKIKAEFVCKVDKDGNNTCSGENDTVPDSVFEKKTIQSVEEIEKILRGAYKKPVFVEFYSSNCPVCRKMIPVMNVIEKSCLKKNLVILKINLTHPENKKFAKKYGIIGVPTFVFLDKDGKEVSRLIGYQEISTIENVLAALTSGECKDFSVFFND